MDTQCADYFKHVLLPGTENCSYPVIDPCFQHSVLTWIPCGYLFISTCFALWSFRNSTHLPLLWTPLLVAKFVLTCVLFVDSMVLFVSNSMEKEKVQMIYPVFLFVSMLDVLALLTLYQKYGGNFTSGVLFVYWLLLGLFSFSEIFWWIWQLQQPDFLDFIGFAAYCLWLLIVVIQLVLSAFVDKTIEYTDLENEAPSPELRSSFINRLFFCWFNSMASTGYRKTLDRTDLWQLNPEESSRILVPKWEKYWNESCSETNQCPSLFWLIIKLTKFNFILGGICKFCACSLKFVNPLALSGLLDFFQDDTKPLWHGILYAFAMFASSVLEGVFHYKWFYHSNRAGINVVTVLTSSIFKKALRLSNSAKSEHSSGHIMNHLSVDVDRFYDVMQFGHGAWAYSFEIIISIALLWNTLGIALFAGLGAMILLALPTFWASHVETGFDVDQMAFKDKRQKLMNEILNSIKVLKFYAWEPSMEKRVYQIRNEETSLLKKIWFLNVLIYMVGLCTPFLIALSSFTAFILINPGHVLTPQKVFVSLVLFNIIKWPLLDIPDTISSFIQCIVSNRRLRHLFSAEEIDSETVDREVDETQAENAIIFQHASFEWNKEHSPSLSDLNIVIPKGKLVFIVGKVGSGKSSLLSAMIGEMRKLDGYIGVNGSIAYVSQEAWIQNMTLKDNILFGKDLDEKTYRTIIRNCELRPDLDSLPAGDFTEIGEKGVNLSGGQKQRVSLGRAIYQDADIYLLDDPLAAVDSHVGEKILKRVIGPDGMLKDKTRILVSHGMNYLEFADQIIVVKEGKITETGTYNELMENGDAFAEFINEYRNKSSQNLAELASRQFSSESYSSVESADKVDSENRNESELIEEEQILSGRVKLNVYWFYLKSMGVLLSLGFIIAYVFGTCFTAASNVWLAHWSDQAKNHNSSNETETNVWFYLSIYGVLGVGEILFTLTALILTTLAIIRSGRILHKQLVHNLMRLPLSFFDATPVGRILNRTGKDIDTCDGPLPESLRLFWLQVTIVVTTLIVIIFATPWFLCVLPPLAFIYYFTFKYYIGTSRQLRRFEAVSRSPIYAHFQQTLQGLVTIRAYQAQNRFIEKSEHHIDDNMTCRYPRFISRQWLGVRLDALSAAVILFAALFAVFGRSYLSAGLVGLSITYAIDLKYEQFLQILVSLEGVVTDGSQLETDIVSVERIREYCDAAKEAPWEADQLAENWPTNGQVDFKDFGVRYREDVDLVLKGLDFTIRPEEKVGIVGRTGAGKTSLTLSLFRILEAAHGQILIDNRNIASLGLQQLRSNLSIIPQDPVLFSGTIRLNLDPFDSYSDSEVWDALAHSHLKDFVSNLPSKLMYLVTEGGENLSLGQRQLVCLARALLRKSKILIMDEATASVDLETDSLIQNTVKKEFSHCTIITIAHRIDTILDNDRVMVLDKGEIKEFDNPQTLLSNNESVFFSMAKAAGAV